MLRSKKLQANHLHSMQEIDKAPHQQGFALLEDEIHVWHASLDLPDPQYLNFVKTLSPYEHARAQQFHFASDKRRYIIRVGILRDLISRYLAISPYRLRFQQGIYGKPKLSDPFADAICFNMSHSSDVAIYGISRCHEIGVDIEYIRDIPEMEQIFRHLFTEREIDVFCKLPESEKKKAFFNCWTRKEAFIKATGEGLSRSLDTFDVSFIPGERARLLSIDGQSEIGKWTLYETSPNQNAVAAVAVDVADSSVYLADWMQAIYSA